MSHGTDPARSAIRNVAIIAHVDHGKTTLVDGMLKQSNIFRDPDSVGDLIMDANDLERERGITILSKNASVTYAGVKINIIDTPGHADFGGEVERVLNMADGCLLLVDAVEGPMPQTRTVLARALQLGLRPIVVINKVDRSAAEPARVIEEVHDLFLDLATNADQLDVPVVYAVAREGRAGLAPNDLGPDLRPLFDAILTHIPAPPSDVDAPFQMQIASLDFDPHRGRIAIGRIHRGVVRQGDVIVHAHPDGELQRERVAYLLLFEGLGRREATAAFAGDIVAITGFSQARIGATLADPAHAEPLPALEIEEPTLRLTFGVNTSPFAGREGQFSTSRQLRERLFRELETNLSLRVEPTEHADVFAVSGRGELHLSILIETMRREGYEFQVSRPEVITKRGPHGLLEPMETLIINATEDTLGVIAEIVGERRGRMTNMQSDGRGGVRLEYVIPTRGTIGLRNALLTRTRGNASMSTSLLGYEPWQGEIPLSRSGALVATETGVALSHGISGAQERGTTFVEPGTEVYEGMIVGQHPRQNDLPVNVCRAKKLTNMRSSTADIMVRLTPPTILSLEQSLDFLADDELLEVTPKSLRLRKRLLLEHERSRARKQANQISSAVSS
ncbi:MAG: translational GTPase TypA [Chloroflexi bacterium]|nr:MAG: translational GTPase TypA [Chloroflexota bacterium]